MISGLHPIPKRPSVPLVGKTIGYVLQSVPLAPLSVARFKRRKLLKNNDVVRMDALYTG